MGLRGRENLTDYRCFFVTTTCNNWKHLFINDKYYDLICSSLKFVCEKYKADLLGYIIMPNHIHLIIYFKNETKLSDLMRDFKKFTSVQIRKMLEEDGYLEILESLRENIKDKKQVFKVWNDRFDDVAIYNEETLKIKLQYLHQNPVRKEIVPNSEDYKYSSARFYLSDRKYKTMLVHYKEHF